MEVNPYHYEWVWHSMVGLAPGPPITHSTIWVDDITLASNSQSSVDKVIKELSCHFKLRDLGPTSYLLGMEITRNRSQHSISLSQRQYIVDILDRFGLGDCKPVVLKVKIEHSIVSDRKV